MAISEEEKDEMFHPTQPEEVDEGIPGPIPDAGLSYHSVLDTEGNVRLFDDSGIEIPLEVPPSYEDPVQVVDDGLSPAQRQWREQWERRNQRYQAEGEEPREPDYLKEIRETKIECDCCGKHTPLEIANCLGGNKIDDEVFAEFGCSCGNTIGVDPHDLPPRYLKKAGEDEDALIQIINDIGWRRKMGLE